MIMYIYNIIIIFYINMNIKKTIPHTDINNFSFFHILYHAYSQKLVLILLKV